MHTAGQNAVSRLRTERRCAPTGKNRLRAGASESRERCVRRRRCDAGARGDGRVAGEHAARGVELGDGGTRARRFVPAARAGVACAGSAWRALGMTAGSLTPVGPGERDLEEEEAGEHTYIFREIIYKEFSALKSVLRLKRAVEIHAA